QSFANIAVFLDRSVNMSISLLAVLRAGFAYMPCLTETPIERLRYMLEDAKVSLFICDAASQDKLTAAELPPIDILSIEQTLALHAKGSETDASDNAEPITSASVASHAFNLIYTSGSTGKPKGVMVNQAGIINRLQWMQRAYPLSCNDRLMQKTPFNFDVSVWELFWPLTQGAELYFLAPDKHKDAELVKQALVERSVTVCHFVPSMLEVYLKQENLAEHSTLRQVFTSGEALLKNQAQAFFAALPDCRLSNLYGPTEAAIDVSWYDCNPEDLMNLVTVPIGVPIDNVQLLVLDNYQQLCPQGCAGELYIAGVALADGYLNMPEKTQQSFIEHSQFGRIYRTGDLARINQDQQLEYLGRTDQQIKLRGQRIELGEIEQNLLQHHAVQAVACALQPVAGHAQLIAYVQLKAGMDMPQSGEFQAVMTSMPEYMWPLDFVAIEALPLSANGKLNRSALPEYSRQQQSYRAAETELEKVICAIMADLLQLDAIGLDDNFFALGGHSLMATQLILQIKQQLNIDLPLKSVFELPNVAALCQLLEVLSQAHSATDGGHAHIDGFLDDDEEDDDFEEGVL
ncbi:MAG: amino acid adenylation domain-containing protein, partial [Pseudomonadales bacterium]|nr:amino acid adenylation domain-containing protein [Pseudomonadales bacterium]